MWHIWIFTAFYIGGLYQVLKLWHKIGGMDSHTKS